MKLKDSKVACVVSTRALCFSVKFKAQPTFVFFTAANHRSGRSQAMKIVNVIGYFRVAFCLCFKARSSAKPLIWK